MLTLDAPWLDSPASRSVTDMLLKAGHQCYFVGGCVRNGLLGEPVSDLDLSTDARPDKVITLAEAADLKAVPTGIEHGTITVISQNTPYEITTWRRDIETDGRRAVIAFADTIEDDAKRRDFTMNALYVDRDGQILDPLGGLPDLEARRVRFIEDPAERIREDRLRILRFFRFSAWYGGDSIDPEGLAACAALAEGVEHLARERVGQEMIKLLRAPDPSVALAAMAQSGVLGRILPGADPAAISVMVHHEAQHDLPPDPITRLAALGADEAKARLRLSKAQDKALTSLQAALQDALGAAATGYFYGAETGAAILLLRAALSGADLPAEDLTTARETAHLEMPVTPRDLMPDFSGAALGERLRRLESAWVQSGFTLDKDALLRFP